jgi:hypothetical protein
MISQVATGDAAIGGRTFILTGPDRILETTAADLTPGMITETMMDKTAIVAQRVM